MNGKLSMTKNYIISLTEGSAIRSGTSPCVITWLSVDRIFPHEEHDPIRAEHITENLIKTKVSLLVSVTNEGVLLDGHHRFAALKKLGIRKIPVAMFDYNDSRLTTGSENTKQEVMLAAMSKQPLPPKTTKHTFEIDGIKLPLIYFSQHFLLQKC